MADLSAYGFEEIDPSKPSNNKESNADLSSYGFEEVKTEKPSPTQIKQQEANINAEQRLSTKSGAEKLGDSLEVGAKGLAKGVAISALDIGDVAGAVLEQFDKTKAAGTKMRQTIKSASDYLQTPSKLEEEHPYSSSIGKGVGYTGGMMIGPGKLIAPAKLIPGIKGASEAIPVTAGFVKGGAENAIAGAAMSEDKFEGAYTGFGLGGLIGGVATTIRKGSQGANQLIKEGKQPAKNLGFDEFSPEAVAGGRANLADKGVNTMKARIQDKAELLAQKKIDNMMPENYQGKQESPTQLLSDDVATTHKAKAADIAAKYKPLQESTATVEIKVPGTKTPIGKLLPDSPPENATFAQLQAYRQALSKAEKGAHNSGQSAAAAKIKEIRLQVSAKMKEVANKAGMGKQYDEVEAQWLKEMKPYYTFSDNGDINVVADKIGTMLGANKFKRSEMLDLIQVLGGESVGKQKVGWAALQTAVRAASKGETFSVQNFNAQVNKFSKLGLDDVFGTPQYKETVKGINFINEQATLAKHIKQHHWSIYIIGPLVASLTQSQKGMRILKWLGSDKPSVIMKQRAINQLIQRTVVKSWIDVTGNGRVREDQYGSGLGEQ